MVQVQYMVIMYCVWWLFQYIFNLDMCCLKALTHQPDYRASDSLARSVTRVCSVCSVPSSVGGAVGLHLGRFILNWKACSRTQWPVWVVEITRKWRAGWVWLESFKIWQKNFKLTFSIWNDNRFNNCMAYFSVKCFQKRVSVNYFRKIWDRIPNEPPWWSGFEIPEKPVPHGAFVQSAASFHFWGDNTD